jgi:hypothetical protein
MSHVLYESRPCSVIVTLGRKIYRIPEIAPPTTISLVLAKKCKKFISYTGKFVLFMIHSQGERKDVGTSMAFHMGLLYAVEASAKICGRIQRYIHFTYQGASTLSGQAFN